MALRTLDDIQRSYIADRQAHEPKTDFEPITPLVIDVELPGSMKVRRNSKIKSKLKAKDPERHGLQPSFKHSAKGRELFTKISDMLFSLAIIMILFVILIPGSGDGAPRTIFNYSYFTVETPSMQDEIPQGSFILVKSIDPQKLTVGDNITYMADQSTTVTHKIVGISENCDNSGVLGFQTQGVNNANPDRDIVYEASVVGKVIFVLPVFGAVLSYLSENVFLVFTIFGLCVLLSFLIRGIFAKPAKRIAPENT